MNNIIMTSQLSKIGMGHYGGIYRTLSALAAQTGGASSWKPEAFKVSVLPNGLTVASIDAVDNGLTSLGMFVKAGSRFETYDNAGISRALCLATGLTTTNFSQFAIRRNMQQAGTNLLCSSHREHLCFSTQILSEFADDGIDYLLDSVCNPCFKPWEVADLVKQLSLDHEILNPYDRCIDMLNKAAFRDGLGNSSLSPKYMIGRHSPKMLEAFHSFYFTSDRCALIGIGISHQNIKKFGNLTSLPTGKGSTLKAKYFGGEIRKPAWVQNGKTFVALVLEGVSCLDKKQMITSMVVAEILGDVPHMKYSKGVGKLQQAVSADANNSSVAVLQQYYSDSGFLGAFITTDASSSEKIIKNIANCLRSITISDAELKAAKKKLLMKFSDKMQNPYSTMQYLGYDALVSGSGAIEFDEENLANLVSSISIGDAQSLVKKICKGKFSLSAYGHIGNVPFVDQL